MLICDFCGTSEALIKAKTNSFPDPTNAASPPYASPTMDICLECQNKLRDEVKNLVETRLNQFKFDIKKATDAITVKVTT